jgi:hypothetical protein
VQQHERAEVSLEVELAGVVIVVESLGDLTAIGERAACVEESVELLGAGEGTVLGFELRDSRTSWAGSPGRATGPSMGDHAASVRRT